MGYMGAYEPYSRSNYVAPAFSMPFAPTWPGVALPAHTVAPPSSAFPVEAARKMSRKQNFFKGIKEEYQNTLKVLQTAPGLALVAALYGTKLLLGPAFTALAVLAGVGHGAYKTLKGSAQNNPEESGKGFFILLVTGAIFLVGARFGITLPGKTSHILGKTYTLATTEGRAIHWMDRLKAAFGLCKYQAENKEWLNAYRLHQLRLKSWAQKLGGSKSI